MSSVVDFLERMGQSAQLRHAAHGDVRAELERAQVEPQVGAAILAQDPVQLRASMGLAEPLYCVQMP